MPNYKGRRLGTRRIVIWNGGKSLEWIVEGTKADGDKFEARKRVELQANAAQQRSVPRFSKLCEAYALHAETHLKASTWQKVRIYQVATLLQHFKGLRVDAFTTDDIDRFKRTRLLEVTRSKRMVGPTAVNNDLRVLTTILNWGREAGYPIPVLKIRKIKRRGNDRVKYWTRDELDRIFASTRKLYPELMRMFLFMLNTGCRKGEALAAQWSWINSKANMVTIPATEHWQPKSGKSRDVPLSDGLKAALSGPHKHPTVVFPTARMNRAYEQFPKDCFWAILKDARVKGNPHMFRHTYASEFLAQVPDLGLLAEVLGHSTTRVTEIYAHLLPGRLERARNAVNITPTMALTMATDSRTA